MAKKKNPVSEYLAKIGKRGGEVTGVAKGTAALSPAERKRRAVEAANARWAGKKKAKE